MGRAPALAACMFCDSLPCECAKRAREANKVAPVKRERKPVIKPEPTVVEITQSAPIATRKRFDALAAMKAASASKSSPVVPAATAPVAPVATEPVVPVVFTPTMAERPVEAKPEEMPDDPVLDYATNLIRIQLGGYIDGKENKDTVRNVNMQAWRINKKLGR